MYQIVTEMLPANSLERVVVPQCIGVIEWTALFFLVYLTRWRLTLLMDTLEDAKVMAILDRMRVLMGYSMVTLALEAFGMGFMDFDIVNWHKAFQDPDQVSPQRWQSRPGERQNSARTLTAMVWTSYNLHRTSSLH